MNSQIKTVVVKSNPRVSASFEADYDKAVKIVNERRAWKNFGTMGFEAYRDWVLTEGGRY